MYNVTLWCFVDGPTPASATMVLELHYVIIVAVVCFLAVCIFLDLLFFRSLNCGILACIYGSMDSQKKYRGNNMTLYSTE